MKRFPAFLLAGLTAITLISAFKNPVFKKRYLITDFGAIGDSGTVNTKAIQTCIDQCSAAGGGTVVVPKGVFVSGAVFLKGGVALLIEKEGVLKGSANRADYPQIKTRWEGTT